MATAKNILSNPAFIGAATAVVTYVVVEELFDDVIEDFFDAIKGKKKDKDGNGGGKHRKRGMKMMKTNGNQFPVMDHSSYFGAWERARGY